MGVRPRWAAVLLPRGTTSLPVKRVARSQGFALVVCGPRCTNSSGNKPCSNECIISSLHSSSMISCGRKVGPSDAVEGKPAASRLLVVFRRVDAVEFRAAIISERRGPDNRVRPALVASSMVHCCNYLLYCWLSNCGNCSCWSALQCTSVIICAVKRFVVEKY